MTTPAPAKSPADKPAADAPPLPRKDAPAGRPAAPPGKGPATARPGATARRGATFVATLALLIALAAAGASYFLWQSLQHDRRELATSIEAVQARADSLSGEARTTLPAIENRLSDHQTALQTLAAQITELQIAHQETGTAIDALRTEMTRDRGQGWRLAEAEYLVRIAGERLALAGDIRTAIAALLAADERLKDASDPALIAARSAITDDIHALQAVTAPDLTGLALTLSSLQQRIDDLPFSSPQEPVAAVTTGDDATAAQPQPAAAPSEAPPADGWRAALQAAWNAIKGLVVVTRDNDAAASPLLTPDQRALVRQNLALKLEAARIAVLQRDSSALRDSIATARDWLLRYFDDSSARSNLLDGLAQFDGLELRPELPTVSASLQALRSGAQRRGDETTSPPVTNNDAAGGDRL